MILAYFQIYNLFLPDSPSPPGFDRELRLGGIMIKTCKKHIVVNIKENSDLRVLELHVYVT